MMNYKKNDKHVTEKASSYSDVRNPGYLTFTVLQFFQIGFGQFWKSSSKNKVKIFYSLCETIEEAFEVQDLANSVTRKLDRLGEVYTMVYDSLQNTRFIRMDRTMLMLEGIIVVLIVIEIILVLVGKL